ncbi:MAG: hypothetical protein E2P01_02370 [Acidobacteria bacterium]|nr:MAG: hypothetical protein E2P01_02370 [Acidobacteriota bacterium]
MKWIPCLAVIFLLASPGVLAKKCKIDLSTEAAKVKTAKCLAFQSTTTGLKKNGPPKKIAVGSFQIRYNLRTQEYGMIGPYSSNVRRTYLQWDDSVYQQVTDLMYDSFVEKMTAEGFEVAALDDVKATSVYQRMKVGTEAKKKGHLVRFTPHGMKHMKMQGALQAQKHLPGINKELGTDAVVSVFLTLSLCQMEKGKLFQKKQRGAYLCFADTEGPRLFQNNPFMVQFYGGYKEGKMPGGKILYSPKWTNGFSKPAEPALYFNEVAHVEKRGWWMGLEKFADPDVEEFAKSAVSAFDIMIDLGLAQYKAKAK